MSWKVHAYRFRRENSSCICMRYGLFFKCHSSGFLIFPLFYCLVLWSVVYSFPRSATAVSINHNPNISVYRLIILFVFRMAELNGKKKRRRKLDDCCHQRGVVQLHKNYHIVWHFKHAVNEVSSKELASIHHGARNFCLQLIGWLRNPVCSD